MVFYQAYIRHHEKDKRQGLASWQGVAGVLCNNIKGIGGIVSI